MRNAITILILLIATFVIIYQYTSNLLLDTLTYITVPMKKTNNIYFMKVPKTGSTTLYGILSRYAIHYNKRVVTYSIDSRPYMRPTNLNAIVELIVPTFNVWHDRKFNILIDHSCFDLPAINKVIDYPAKYITMLRKPIDVLRSMHYYNGFGRRKEGKSVIFFDPLLEYLKKPRERFINPVAKQFRINLRMTNSSFLKQVERLENTFVVGIHEYYNHSLILLKRRLGWHIKDMVFLPLRKQSYHNHISFEKKADIFFGRKVCEINKYDCYIYNHFNNSLWKSIKREGKSFQKEVTYFESILVNTSGFCNSLFSKKAKLHEASIKLNDTLYITQSKWSTGFYIKPFDCAIMRLDEPALSAFFFYLQNPNRCRRDLVYAKGKKQSFYHYHSELCPCVGNKMKMLLRLLYNKNAVLHS